MLYSRLKPKDSHRDSCFLSLDQTPRRGCSSNPHLPPHRLPLTPALLPLARKAPFYPNAQSAVTAGACTKCPWHPPDNSPSIPQRQEREERRVTSLSGPGPGTASRAELELLTVGLLGSCGSLPHLSCCLYASPGVTHGACTLCREVSRSWRGPQAHLGQPPTSSLHLPRWRERTDLPLAEGAVVVLWAPNASRDTVDQAVLMRALVFDKSNVK